MKNAKKYINIFCLLLIAFYLTACSSSNLYAVKNNELANNKYRHIIIFIPLSDMYIRTVFEDAFVKYFLKAGIQAESSIKLFPPVKEYDGQDIKRILEQNNIDGAIMINVGDTGVNTFNIPPSSTTISNYMFTGNSVLGYSQTTTGPGLNLSQAAATFKVSFVDTKKTLETNEWKIAWLATAHIKDILRDRLINNSPSLIVNNIADLLAAKVTQQLIEENLVSK